MNRLFTDLKLMAQKHFLHCRLGFSEMHPGCQMCGFSVYCCGLIKLYFYSTVNKKKTKKHGSVTSHYNSSRGHIMVHQLINPQALKQFLQLLSNSLWQYSADRVFALQESKSVLSMLFLAGRHVLCIWAHLSLGLTEPHQWGTGRGLQSACATAASLQTQLLCSAQS